MQTRNYENQQGQRVYVTEVVADSFQLLESRNTQEQRGGNSQAPSQNNYGNTGSQTPDFGNGFGGFGAGSSTPMDISDDDLPF